jgi:DNA-binding MarR family transcriptional regulator
VAVKSLHLAVRELVRALGALSEEQTPCGAPIPPREAHALLLLREREAAGEVLAQTDLQRIVGIDKSNVARLVQRLGERDWVRQEADPTDGRRRRVVLTARGRKLAGELETRGEALFQAVWQALAPADREAVTHGVQRLGEALRAVAERKEPSRAS